MHGPAVMLLMNCYIRNKFCLNQLFIHIHTHTTFFSFLFFLSFFNRVCVWIFAMSAIWCHQDRKRVNSVLICVLLHTVACLPLVIAELRHTGLSRWERVENSSCAAANKGELDWLVTNDLQQRSATAIAGGAREGKTDWIVLRAIRGKPVTCSASRSIPCVCLHNQGFACVR